MRKFLVKDSSGKPSVTTTAFIIGFFVVNFKLLMSGIKINDTIKFIEFGGGDYAAALAALGAIYVLRKHSEAKTSEQKEG